MRETHQPADRDSIRRTNLALILQHLERGPRSRTSLALDLELPKATVSSLVAELVRVGLASEGDVDRVGVVGRPRRMVELDGRGIRGVGVEIAADHIHMITRDLRGTVTASRSVPVDVRGAEVSVALATMSKVVAEAVREARADGGYVAGVAVAAPGSVDPATGVVTWAPTIGWNGVDVFAAVHGELGADTPDLQLINDAKLVTIAEYMAVADTGVRDLVAVTGGYGLGAGVVVAGRTLEDAAGRGPEIGHMPINPESVPCVCGRRACWETMVDLGALLRLAADRGDPVVDPARDLETRLQEIKQRADSGDPRTLAALKHVTTGLGLGVSVLVDLFSPEVVILGGYFAHFADYVVDRVQDIVNDRMFVAGRYDVKIATSSLGLTAAARGGSHLALTSVFSDPAAFGSPLIE